MSATVEHEKRKREILEQSLDVFIEEGYGDTTFQKIADKCGITRTILYLYFRNKREIFSFSVKLFTEKLEASVRSVAASEAMAAPEKLTRIIALILGVCVEQKRMLVVIMDYFYHIRKSNADTAERIKRRTIRMRHIISGIIIAGEKRGEFIHMPVKTATDLLYALIETALLRVSSLGRTDISDLEAAAAFFVERIKA